jgi:hypothetical protein
MEAIGWIATAFFSASYFFRTPAALRRFQAGAAGLWIIYGLSIKALPVVIANVIVAAAALFTMLRDERAKRLSTSVVEVALIPSAAGEEGR